MCVSLQGCLLTRDVHYTELVEIGRKLKLLVASCNSHSLRKNGYPVKILSAVTAQKVVYIFILLSFLFIHGCRLLSRVRVFFLENYISKIRII